MKCSILLNSVEIPIYSLITRLEGKFYSSPFMVIYRSFVIIVDELTEF